MNIGLVTPYFPDSKALNSGIANHFNVLAAGLSAAGHNVIVLHVRPHYHLELNHRETRQLNANTILITCKAKLPKNTAKLAGKNWVFNDLLLKLQCMRITTRQLPYIIKQYKLDIIETSSYFSLTYMCLFRLRKTPVLVRVSTTFLQVLNDHYPFKSRMLEWFGRLEIKMMKRSRHLITHTSNHAHEMEHLYQVQASNFCIIPHGINLPALVIQDANVSKNITVLYVGRFEYRKGIDVLLAAIPEVIEKMPGIVFELIGADAGNSYIDDFIKAQPARITDNVKFHGVLSANEIAQAYADCTLFVAPSRYESFGLVYIEAMGYGKPVIGCKIGGASEIIQDQYNGLLAEVDNVSELAEKIYYLASNKDKREEMGANARTTVQKYFSAQTLVANSLNYYSSVLQSKAH